MALNPSGSLLAVTSNEQVEVYSTVNGHLVDTSKITHNNLFPDELFAAAAFQDDTVESVITLTTPDVYKGEILAADDHQCLLMVKNSNIKLFNKTMSKHRNIAINGSPPQRRDTRHHWYDKDRGLVFCVSQQLNTELSVVRVTL